MRSWLFVPADSERKLSRAVGAGADCLIVDLEDSVSLDAKPRARELASEFVGRHRTRERPEIYVRINPLTSGLAADDLDAVLPAVPSGIVLPKADGIQSVERLSAMLDSLEKDQEIEIGSTRILPIITETAAGVLAVSTWNLPPGRLSGVTWGAEDLSADLGIARPRNAAGEYTDVFRYARMMTIVAAGACETAAIDTVFVDYRDDDRLAQECHAAARDGFAGKLAIHPAQVPHINEAFSVTAEEIAEARAIVDAFAEAGDPGVVGIGGKMYDRPHLRRAERILARAEAQASR